MCIFSSNIINNFLPTWGQFGVPMGSWSFIYSPLSCNLYSPCGSGFIIYCCYSLTWHSNELLHLWHVGPTCTSEWRVLWDRVLGKLQKEFAFFAAFASPHCMSTYSHLQPSPPSCVVLTTCPLSLDFSHVTALLLWGINGFKQYLACDKCCLSSGVMVVIIPTECLSQESRVITFFFSFFSS